MRNQGVVLQAVGDDGIVQRWFRRSYVRHLPTRRNLFEQQQDEGTSNDQQVVRMLDPQKTTLQELGVPLLARVFQCLPIIDRLRMEHVSRIFRSTSTNLGWLAQRKVVVIPEEAMIEGRRSYLISGRAYFRLIMKRCCRYTLELTIFELVPGDRLFKLLQLCFLLQHICLDSLSPLSGSEFLQISDRLPELKSLVVKNCRLHFKFARDFQRMLDGLQHLQVLSVTKCESFDKLEIERLPSSLRILQLNYLDGSFDRQLRLIQTIRQNVPNINVLILDESTELAHFQIQAFQNIKVLILPFDNWDWRSNRWENVEFYPPEFLQRLTALDLGNIAIEFGILRISAMQLPRLEYLVINLIRTSNVNQLFTQIVGLPSLRSFTFEMKGNNWENLNYKHRDKQLYNSLVSLAQKGLIEYLDVSLPLNTAIALEFVKNCSKLRSLFFKGRISKQRETWEEFDWRNFHKLLSDLKKGELPKENGEKLQMLKIVFGDWKGELFLSSWQLVTTTHPWIECFDKPTPSHVLEEVCLRELGENADVTTELFKFPPRVKVPEKIINNE
ncbi:hypothetical protein ACQ4LE_002196 [Meloidogyne hapla]